LANLPKLSPKIAFVKPIFEAASTSHVVLSADCSKDVVCSWLKLSSIPKPGALLLVTPDWIEKSLKAKTLLDPLSFLHPLQRVDSLKQDHQQGIFDSNTQPIASARKPPDNLAIVVNKQAGNVFNRTEASDRATSRLPVLSPTSALLSSLSTKNQNEHITRILQQLQEFYDLQKGNQDVADFRGQAYRRCCAKLSTLPRVTRAKDLAGIDGFGESIISKIDEILKTGRLQKLENFKKDPVLMSKMELMKIWGVGVNRADTLYRLGYHSVEDLRSRGEKVMTATEKKSVLLFEELQERIPREEVEEIGAFVKSYAERYHELQYCMCSRMTAL
jgi:ERCC4-type nuclease